MKGLEEADGGNLMEEHRGQMTRTDHCTDYSLHCPGGTLAPEPPLSVSSASLQGLNETVYTRHLCGELAEYFFPFYFASGCSHPPQPMSFQPISLHVGSVFASILTVSLP